MKQFLLLLSIAIFSIFLGGQITEGVLLVPYWQSLSSSNFHAYYSEFGPSIGQFYTILTILAKILAIFAYCRSIKSEAAKYALISSVLAILFTASFYVYFKEANDLFYQATLSDAELKNELVVWSYWHWGRISVECLSLVFLMLAVSKILKAK